MAAVTAENTTDMKSKQILEDGFIVEISVAASTTIYKNTFVGLNATGDLTSFVAWTQAASPAGTRYFGIALENVDNSGGSAGDLNCKVMVSGVLQYPLTSAAKLDVGAGVYCSTNADLTKSGVGNGFVGTIIALQASGVVVIDMMSPTAGNFGNGGQTLVTTALMDVGDGGTVADENYALHETQNHNGAWLLAATAVHTEALAMDNTAAVVTIAHTLGTDTSLGCTLTGVDNSAIADATLGSGGLWRVAASDAALVQVPADKGAVAKLTTASIDAGTEAGKWVLFCEWLLV